MNVTLKIRRDQLDKYRRIAGLTTEQRLANRMGIHQGTLNKVLNGRQMPSARFIAALITAFDGANFDDLWEVVSHPDAGPDFVVRESKGSRDFDPETLKAIQRAFDAGPAKTPEEYMALLQQAGLEIEPIARPALVGQDSEAQS